MIMEQENKTSTHNNSTNNSDNEQPIEPIKKWIATLLILYLILVTILTIYGLIAFLPIDKENNTTLEAKFIFWIFNVTIEIALFISVMFAGVLGSLVHAFRSLYWYIGNKKLAVNWVPKYILIPFVGAVLGLSFYLIIRGGFFAAGSNVSSTNPYGFIAVGILIGMFSEQAVLKLKELAETLLAKPQPGSQSAPQPLGADKINK